MIDTDKSNVGQTPILTIVVPAHNVAEWIDDCLTSLREQSVRDCRIIVVDDHSTDATVEVATAHANEDPRVEIVASPMRGGGSARNYGAALATGTYLAFADGDDLIPHEAYAPSIAGLDETRADFSMSDYLIFGQTQTRRRSTTLPIYGVQRVVTIDQEPRMLRDRTVWNKVFRRSWWLDQGIEFPDSLRSNDIAAMVKAFMRANVLLLPGIAYVYRSRPGQGSMTASGAAIESMCAHFEQELRCAELLEERGSRQATEYYRSMIFGMDALAHLRRYPELWNGAPDGRLLTSLQRLWSTVPAEAVKKIKPEARWIFAQIEAGIRNGADFLPRESRRLIGLPDPTALPQRTAAALESEQAAALLRESVSLTKRFASLANDSGLIGFGARVASLARSTEPMLLERQSRALIDACEHDRVPADLRAFAMRHEIPSISVATAVIARAESVSFDLAVRDIDTVDARLVALELTEERSGELRHVESVSVSRQFLIDSQDLPPQTAWSLMAVLEAPSGARWRLPVLRDGVATPRHAALGLRDGATGAPMLVDIRRSVPQRALLKSSALLKRAAHEAQRRSARTRA